MQDAAYGQGLDPGPSGRSRYACPDVSPTPHPLRLALPRPPAQRRGPGPDRPHRGHRRGRAPDRLGARLQRLARVLGRAPDPGAPVPRAGRVRQPAGDRRARRRRGGRLPGRRVPLAPAAGPDVAERRPGGRRAGPGRARRHRRLHQAQPLRGHGALLRHHAPAGRRRRAGAPRPAGLLAGVGPPARAPPAHPPLLRPAGPAGRGHRRRDGDDGGRPPRRRDARAAGGQAPPRVAARHGRAPLEPGPAPGGGDHRPGGGAAHGRRPRAGAAGRADPRSPSWWPRRRSATPSTSPTCPRCWSSCTSSAPPPW